MLRHWISAGLLAALSGIAGCAASGLETAANITTPAAAAGKAAPGTYVLSADEQELDCKKLTGRMQIRILEIRDYNERQQATLLSRAIQTGVAALTGGSKAGTDPYGQYTQDRAMLEAYNKQLSVKNCKTYDLDAELKPKDFRETPNPTIKPASGPAAKAK